MGVIYSNTGFSTQAIEKARANQIVCCRLYQDEPADLPSVIWFDQFACHAGVRLTPKTDAVATATTTWNDLFDIEIEQGDKRETLLDVIASVFAEGEDEAIRKIGGAIVFPSDWGTEIALGDSAGNELRVQVWGRWTWYRARSEATLLDGSYCLSDGSFKGSQSGPMISLRDKHPGPSWVEVTDRDLVPPANRITAIRCSGDVRTALRQSYGPQLVRAQESSCS